MIAPDGYSGLRCTTCGVHLSMDQEKMFYASSRGFFCACGARHSYATKTTSISILPDSANFVSSEGKTADESIAHTLASQWFHATTQRNWYENIMECNVADYRSLSVPMVHVGTLHSAHERSHDIKMREPNKNIYLHTLVITEGNVHPHVFSDDDGNAPENVGQMKNSPYSNVNRYVNEVESPGSVSLLINPISFKVVATEKIYTF